MVTGSQRIAAKVYVYSSEAPDVIEDYIAILGRVFADELRAHGGKLDITSVKLSYEYDKDYTRDTWVLEGEVE